MHEKGRQPSMARNSDQGIPLLKTRTEEGCHEARTASPPKVNSEKVYAYKIRTRKWGLKLGYHQNK